VSSHSRLAAQPRPSSAARERAADRLREACADDRLSLQTFAARLDLAYAARTEAELTRLFADLAEPSWFGRMAFRAVTAVSRWTSQLDAAWREPRTRRISLSTGPDVFVGRSRSCECVIGDPDVSRRHARLRHADGRWWLADMGSANGTYVNGWRVADEVEVRPGDEVWFGDAHFILERPMDQRRHPTRQRRRQGRYA
jgi:hypothetical protein